eukprot:8740811-Pyramimonas_sp.AAC.1
MAYIVPGKRATSLVAGPCHCASSKVDGATRFASHNSCRKHAPEAFSASAQPAEPAELDVRPPKSSSGTNNDH